jgi:hypothetical protein
VHPSIAALREVPRAVQDDSADQRNEVSDANAVHFLLWTVTQQEPNRLDNSIGAG